MQNSCDKNEKITYAGFWVRLWAYAIDSVLAFLLVSIARLFMLGVTAVLEGTPLGGNVLFQYTLKDIILYGFHVLYFILFTYYTGTTPGKKLLNLRVIRAEGGKPSFIDVVFRETVGRFLCGVILNVGYIMAGLDQEKRGLHDILCDTRVVYAKKVTIIPAYAYRDPGAPYVPRQVTPPPAGPAPSPWQSGPDVLRPGEEQQKRNEEEDS